VVYVFDTSALVDAWSKWYSPESIPTFWDNLEELARRGDATIPDAVLLELESMDDDLYRWCHDREDFFCTATTEDIQLLITQISDNYPNLRRAGMPSRNFADPVVIALALHFGATVITHEMATGNLNGPRIPDVCRDIGIRVMQVHTLVRELQWQFR
jgi:hypothetical protein